MKLTREVLSAAVIAAFASAAYSQAPDVLIVFATPYSSYEADVRSKLLDEGVFSAVDTFDASNGSGAVPSPTLLGSYDAVLVFSDSTWSSRSDLGDAMADYFDAGGGVVTAVFEIGDCCGNATMTGGWASGGSVRGYQAFVRGGGQVNSSASLGTIHVPGHPILDGVAAFAASNAFRTTLGLNAEATSIAEWNDGNPLVALIEPNGDGRLVVDLNMYPPSSDVDSRFWDSSTDGGRLMANALLFAANQSPTGGGADDGGSVFIDSQFSQDAILYEGATPGVGSTVLIAGRRTQVGDNVNNRAERGLLGFTTAIPGAEARSAALRLTVDGKTGNVSGLGDLEIYYADPFYGTTAGWQASDFQAAPTSGTPVATIPNAALVAAGVGDALWVSIDPTLVPLSGNVQFRLQFANGTDGDNGNDNIRFGAGGQSSSNRHERSDLVVEFDLATTNGCGTNPSTGGDPLVLDPLYSLPNPDGTVIEYTANAGVGLLTDNANAIGEFGDLPTNQQVKALLAFDTSVFDSYGTPEVTSASLCITRESFAGDPSTLGRVYVEMLCPNQAAFFGPSAGLDREDFESYAWITDATAEQPVLPRANGDTICWPLSAEALAALNRLGPTQFRLRFENADSDNATKDTFRFYTGNASGTNRARLDIEIAQ
ncbi:MAG: hypothetical protein SF028_09175 [Candidatus Sumerlaeia bacterium]|nr:hypothetical protein [Candidatus Sumerlaeia bacterium]